MSCSTSGASSTTPGPGGAAASAHPLATRAAARILHEGGSAVDAAIAAQAVICVVMPQAAGLGGDMLALVHEHGQIAAVNGTGLSPRGMQTIPETTGGTSVTVPGLVDGWVTLSSRWGLLPLDTVLAPAIEIATVGVLPDPTLAAAVGRHMARLESGGAEDWSLLSVLKRPTGDPWIQRRLADLLEQIAHRGRAAFYTGSAAAAVVDAVGRCGGWLDMVDLADHVTPCPSPITVGWDEGKVHVQPPMSQGVLLAMALRKVRRLVDDGVPIDDHVLVEVTEAAFAYRSSCLRGADLMSEDLAVDPQRAAKRGGPRAYLHTAGVATVDRYGQVVSSLVSVFDDFGSGVFVPELGIVLNNRAAGFTDGDNAAAPGKRPVHTLAPAMVTSPVGVLGIATPGADGQVQTLLQVLVAMALTGQPLDEAITEPRWRTQDGDLLVETGHPAAEELVAKGHRVVAMTPGAEVFGSVVAAGTYPTPLAAADWRRIGSSQGVQ